MPYLYLLGAVLFASATKVFAAGYGKKHQNEKAATPLYNLVYAICVCVIWGISYAITPTFKVGVFPYALGFGVCYALATIGLVYAVKTGPLALTSLVVALSLTATAVWGLLFWNSTLTWFVGLGLCLIVVSLWLCLRKGQSVVRISWRWGVFAGMAFVGNAGCTIVQRMQQTAFEGKYGSALMFFGTVISTIVCIVLYVRVGKGDGKKILKSPTACLPVLGAATNVLLNVCMMRMATSVLSPTLIYPTVSVGGIVVVSLFSLFVFREKMTRLQWLGVGVGAVAVALLSL